MAQKTYSSNREINAETYRRIKQGYRIENAGRSKHKLFYPDSKRRFVIVDNSPSDWRAYRNFLSRLARCEMLAKQDKQELARQRKAKRASLTAQSHKRPRR